jgi:hypothetical protein
MKGQPVSQHPREGLGVDLPPEELRGVSALFLRPENGQVKRLLQPGSLLRQALRLEVE